MLVLAALCLNATADRQQQGEETSDLLQSAEICGTKWLREYGSQLQEMRPSDFDSIVAFSRLVCPASLAFFSIRRKNGMSLADQEAWTWMQLFRGVGAVQTAVLESDQCPALLMTNDQLGPEVVISQNQRPIYTQNPSNRAKGVEAEENPRRSRALFHAAESTRNQALWNLRSSLDVEGTNLEPESHESRQTAIELLERTCDHIFSANLTNMNRAVFTWPVQIPKAFVDAVVDGMILARVIYAHWLVLVMLLDDLWWVDDMGATGIREIVEHCGEVPILEELLQWPMSMLQVAAT